jgi:hypothetical protein
MSTLRVDKIAPFQSSSVEIDGTITLPTMATTGSNTFVGNQIVTGSIDITGQFLVNGIAVSGSGGGSVNTSSLATTGSNTFEGDQTVNGFVLQNITAPAEDTQTDFVTVSGVEINGVPYDYTNFSIYNYASVGGGVFEDAFAFESYSDNISYEYGGELKFNGLGLDAVVFASGSSSGGALSLTDKHDETTEAKLQADAVLIGKISGSSTVTGNFVVAVVDTLPAGIPGQIAFQGGNMHVYISGQWNQVAFV